MDCVQLGAREVAVGCVVDVRVHHVCAGPGVDGPGQQDLLGLEDLDGCDHVAHDDAVLDMHVVQHSHLCRADEAHIYGRGR